MRVHGTATVDPFRSSLFDTVPLWVAPILSMIKTETLSDETIVMWGTQDVDNTALLYYPPEDKMKRLYNSP